MELFSQSFRDGDPLPVEFAFADIDAKSHAALSQNRNPHFAWQDVPAAVKSFALVCCDPDVPSSGEDVNREDREIPTALARVDFFHWLLLDLPAAAREIAAGSYSDGVTARGKPGPAARDGTRQGINDFTDWFASEEQMRGNYYGYDGAAPPWNDALVHHYVFTLYALDVARLQVDPAMRGRDVLNALEGHILQAASLTATYTLNPRLRAR